MSNVIDLVVSKQAQDGLDKLYVKLKESHDLINLMSQSGIKFNSGGAAKNIKDIAVATDDYKKQLLSLEQAEKRQFQATNEINAAIQKRRFETKQLNDQTKQAATLSSALASEYQKLVVKMNQAASVVQNLNAKRLQGNQLSKIEVAQLKKSEIEFARYQKAVLGADASVGRFQRNVGNYPKGLLAAGNAARSLAGALGLLSGAFIAIRVVGDAFKRIRDFDKEMQNMAGILRTTRPELKDLENRIIKVAAASVKTSNEVAQLATSLLVLGKSKEDVLQLLEPVNNLSIALNATSDETGEFLVQTLNAFGKGSESAADFADTIAAIRTSTSLDFQKMRDSFQYITPISKILGKDLAYTGAVVGVLADNGIKAESAGRLLATAQIKIATSGKTLNEALDELTDAYLAGKDGTELLTLANASFGKQAAKIGVTLATQRDRIDEYDAKIRQAGGSLDDLVEQQLKSVDAQLKITTSNWERFILSIEKGDGVLSKAFGGFLKGINKVLEGLYLLNLSTDDYNASLTDDIAQQTRKDIAKSYKEMGENASKLAITEADRSRDQVDNINSEIKLLKERNSVLEKQSFIKNFINPDELANNKKKIEELSKSLGYYQGVLTASEDILLKSTEATNANTESTDKNEESKTRTVQKLQDLIKAERERLELLNLDNAEEVALAPSIRATIDAYQKEIDAILGNNKARKETIKINKGSISYFEKIISVLEDEQKRLATNGNQWQTYQDKIDTTKQSLQDFIVQVKGLNGIKSIGDLESSLERIRDIISDNDFGKIDGLDYDRLNSDLESFSKKFEEQQQMITDIQVDYAKRRRDIEAELTNNLIELGTSVAEAIFQSQINAIDREQEANQRRLDIALQFAGDSYAAQEELKKQANERDAKLEKEKAEIKKKAFLFEQAIKFAEIAIDTIKQVAALKAEAAILAGNPITAALASIPLALIPTVITTGAIAGAAVIAQSIPAFKEGVSNFGGGLAIVGDGGVNEVLETNKGVSLTPNKDTLVNLPKGSNVYKNQEDYFKSKLNSILLNNGISPINEINVPKGFDEDKFDRIMGKHIAKLGGQSPVLNVDEKGFKTYMDNGQSRREILNARVRGLRRRK